ncbi:MAG: hypothetical protein HY791_28530 [Deltaproteobacteria bacterium]|nr:hypothetical protein [Deltaproteobacteria bacterium]
MSLKHLSVDAMIRISDRWLNPAKDRALLESIPLAAALLPAIEGAHRGLSDLRAEAEDRTNELARVFAEAEAADQIHDRKLRGSFGLLTVLAELADSSEISAELMDLRDRLMPQGLRATHLSHVEEAVNAESVRQALDEETRAELRTIPTIEGRTLEQEIETWLAAAAELGHLTAQRVLLEHEDRSAAEARAERIDAKNAWIRSTHALLAVLDLTMGQERRNLETLLKELRAAERRADRRHAKKLEAINEPK